MSHQPAELTLELTPSARVDVIDLRRLFPSEHREALAPYPRCLYWSGHTTAGFLGRGLASRLTRQRRVGNYLEAFQTLFPEGAGYEHDRLERRDDLDTAQRRIEPRNAHSHLAYIAAGLRPCVRHPNRPGEAVCFVDLDGVNSGQPRRRMVRVIGYHDEEEVARQRLEVPASGHAIDSINLRDRRLGIDQQLTELVRAHGVTRGRLHLALAEGQRDAGLTINEYETLLMRHDLADVLRDPLRFAAEKGRHILADPLAVPAKTLEYARYDLLRVMNQVVDLLGLRHSLAERVLARAFAVPAARVFRLRRSVSLLVSDSHDDRASSLVAGRFQSPILVQWQPPPSPARLLDVTLTRLR